MTRMVIDNRAADLPGLFSPPQRNATAVPRLVPACMGDGHLEPGTPVWSHYNRRRAELIRRKVREGLLPREEEELDWLQRETLAAVDRVFPRPLVDRRALAD